MKTNKMYEKILIMGMIYYFIEVFFLHWLCLDQSIKFCSILIIIILVLVKSNGKLKVEKKYVWICLTYCLYLMINLLFTQDHTKLASRIVYYTITPISIYSFFIFFSKNEYVMEKYGQDIIPKFLNIYFFINIPILILQCRGDGFLMLQLNSDYFNHFYLDHISGLLGLDGTHKLAILTIAVIYANIYMGMKTKKKIYYVYTIIDIVFSLTISMYNDNKALFIILPIMLLPIIYNVFKSMKNKIIKTFFIVLLCLMFLVIAYNSSNMLQTLLEEKILYLFDENSKRNLSEQERTYVVKYALEEGNGFFIGNGIGCKFPKLEPKAHFGINDMSVLIYEGGLIYYFLWCVILTTLIYDSIFQHKKNNKMKILLFLYIMFFIYYNQIITNWKLSFLLGLIFLMYKNINDLNYYTETKKE